MRLFIAIPVEGDTQQQLADLQQPVQGIRWQKKEQMHLTLKFLGESSGEQFQQLLPLLKEVEANSFSINIQGVGYFPKGKDPKVLWAGVELNEALIQLQEKVEEVCEKVGVEPEQRPFKPHITIGRVKGGTKGDVMSFINQHKQFRVSNVPVNEFVLFESKLSPEGAKHHRRKVLSLRG